MSETGAGSDVASIKTTRAPRRRRLGDQRRQDVDHQRRAGRLDVPAGQHRRRPGAQEQVADRRADEDQRACRSSKQARQARHARVGHRADLLRRRAGAAALPIGQEGTGFIYQMHAVPGGAAVGRRGHADGLRPHDRRHHRVHARAQGVRPAAARQPGRSTSAWPSCKTEVEALRALVYRACEDYVAGTDVTMLASMAKLKAGRLRREVSRRLPAVLGRHGLSCGTTRWRAATATAGWARSAAAPTRSCCRSSAS